MAVHYPTLKWAQRKDCLYITIEVVHTSKPIIDIIDGKKLKYEGTDGEKTYQFEIELYEEVLKDQSKFNLGSRNIFLNIKKKTTGPYWPRLIKDSAKLPWIQVDWVYFTEEDEEEEAKEPQFGGENFGDMGEMDEDDEPPKENDNHCNCGHEHCEDHKEEEKAADISDLDKEEKKN